MNVTLILPADRIPCGSVVRKITGQKTYTLRTQVTVHGSEQTIVGNGVVFLFSENGTINACPSNTLLAVDLPLDGAITTLQALQLDEELATGD